MNARFLHPAGKKKNAPALSAPSVPVSEHADCCSAKALVRVIMPPDRERPRHTDLLLCGHHYRASRSALAAASAVVRRLPGTPSEIAEWLQLDRPAYAS
jgi:hypothetical protein